MDEAQAKSIEDKIVQITDVNAVPVLKELYGLALKLKDINIKQHQQLHVVGEDRDYWKNQAGELVTIVEKLQEKYKNLEELYRDVSLKYAILQKQTKNKPKNDDTVTITTGWWPTYTVTSTI
jgi:hypothetical protein